MTRRSKGTGSIYKDSSGLYVCAIELPPDPATGKRRRKVVRSKRHEVVSKRRAELLRELGRAGNLVTTSPTVSAYLDTWMDGPIKRTLKPRTYQGYRSYVDNHIKPAIGRKRLDKLRPSDAESMTAAIIGKGLSSTTALQAHRILQRALRDAEREGLVQKNVAALAYAPRKAITERPALTADEAMAVMTTATGVQRARLILAFMTGCRQGEALGLRRDLVNFILDEAGEVLRARIEFAWSIQRLSASVMALPAGQEGERAKGGLWLVRPKTRSSWRVATVHGAFARELARILGSHTSDWVCPAPDGGPRDPRADHAAWEESLALAGVRDVPLHSARHTAATLTMALASEQTRMRMLGHTSASTTRGYTHIGTDDLDEIAESYAGLMLPSGGFPQLSP